MSRPLLLCTLIFLAGCGGSAPKVALKPESPQTPPTAKAADTPPSRSASPVHVETNWPDLILPIAANYTTYPRVSDQANWAPFLCIAQATPTPAGIQASNAPESSPHGHKLYHLYARDGDDYLRLPFRNAGATSTIGQAIVKRTYTPVEITSAQARALNRADVAQRDGRFYRTGQPGDLFIMTKLDPDTPGTHDGWVYAITDNTGQNLIAAGRIASCMSCHERAPHDRLFGLKDAWRER